MTGIASPPHLLCSSMEKKKIPLQREEEKKKRFIYTGAEIKGENLLRRLSVKRVRHRCKCRCDMGARLQRCLYRLTQTGPSSIVTFHPQCVQGEKKNSVLTLANPIVTITSDF
ncbi:hypothetical protein OUZ56_030677 [Daphnia magna]|uniref:Uncharacterized protein n=1 Tax=Daphnia magna TaxID=35525 RepID=A0ABQ9ZRZ6_9CRUS|nr:hypothetical protein OUZ56_030677 [Daphnia magna]